MTALATATATGRLTEVRAQNELHLQITGPLTSATIETWRETFETLAATSAQRVVIDMADVQKLDASGLGAIAYLFKRLMSRERKLVLTSVSGQPQRMLTELGLADLLGMPKAAGLSRVRGWFGAAATAAVVA